MKPLLKSCNALILLIFIWVSPSWAISIPGLESEFDLSQLSNADIVPTEEDKSEAHKCRLLRSVAEDRSKFICDRRQYLLFGPDSGHEYNDRSARYGKLKIASFNLLHLGNLITPYKQLDLIAKMMNQWDIVAALEMKTIPTTSIIHTHNLRVLDRLEEIQEELKDISRDYELSRVLDNQQRKRELIEERTNQFQSYIFPGYIQLLFALKELDPSWSLIMTAEGQGQGHHQELTGFYYRAKRVKNLATRACNAGRWGAYACFMDIPRSEESLVSRPAFIAGFQSGADKYSLYAAHTRFEEHENEEDGEQSYDLAREALVDLAEEIGNEDLIGDIERMARPFISRFFEVTVTLREMQKKVKILTEMSEASRVYSFTQGFLPRHLDHNFILLGDFNLPTDNYLKDVWTQFVDHLMPGFKIYIDGKTSISAETGLSEPYDHIIANPEQTTHCNLDQEHLSHSHDLAPATFDFTQIIEPTSQADIRERIRLATSRNTRPNIVDATLSIMVDWVKEWRGLSQSEFEFKLQSLDPDEAERSFIGLTYPEFVNLDTVRRGQREPLIGDERVEKMVADMWDRLINIENDNEAPYRSIIHGFSDHLPVYMTCD
ncbi:MAG: hypothetical protein CL677_02400 [Bdellovibrionaceae bacterium]|nr:hypothetical protein [Pseudobdellovibrionaceae bacterium]